MRPLDGTNQAGCKGARHSNLSFARNARPAQPGRGNCVIDPPTPKAMADEALATAACNVPIRESREACGNRSHRLDEAVQG